jgi:hypothetical protein
MAFWLKKVKSNIGRDNRGFSGSTYKNITQIISQSAQENFSKDRFALSCYIFCLLSILAQSSLILVSWSKLPPQVPIFYSRPWGETMLTSPLGLWLLPGLLLVLATINFFLISNISQNRFLARMVITFTLGIAFLSIYDTAKIISLLI